MFRDGFSESILRITALQAGKPNRFDICPLLHDRVASVRPAMLEIEKDVMSSLSTPTCRDLLSSSVERVRAGIQTVELEEAPGVHRNGT